MLGICQWFHYEDYEAVRRSVSLLKELRIRRLRTGISWADYHRPGGPAWYDWQMEQLADFDVLLSIWHTPPSIAEGGECAGPPRRLEEYGEFVGQMIDRYGHRFSHLELWNEPNNRYKWDFARYDPQWAKFGKMIRLAARVAKDKARSTVLGGIIPVDPDWLELMAGYGALEDIDIIAIHGFPQMWWSDQPCCWEDRAQWRGWPRKIACVERQAAGRPIWVTETGLATWDLRAGRESRLSLQSRMLEEAAAAPAERVYWYSLVDLATDREAIEGFHVDENEYHLGLVRDDGSRKPAWHTMRRLMQRRREARLAAQ